MKIFQKFFKDDQKLNANEIAIEIENNKYQVLDNIVKQLIGSMPMIAYDNEEGSNQNITLDLDASYYRYAEIHYRDNNNIYNSTKVYKPNGKTIYLMTQVPTTDANGWWSYIKSKTISITGKSLSVISYNENILHDKNMPENNHLNNIYITKILFYN